MADVISRAEARRFYDRFGARQDRQGFYEDAAVDLMIELGNISQAGNVLELGCGTARLAEELLSNHLSPAAHYAGVDISSTMVRLAERRLAPFGERVELHLSDGDFDFSRYGGPFDRIISTYVLDLLSPQDIHQCLAGAHAALTRDGLFCHTGLTRGMNLLSKFSSSLWTLVHNIRPLLVGGCRPLMLTEYLSEQQWQLVHREVVVSATIPSEVVVLKARQGTPERQKV